MAKQKYSIKDIAKQLNISITTVSFILNGKAKENRISEKLTLKVLEHVKKVGYKPNQLAQSLRTGKSKILVFMVEDISNSFFSSIARMMEAKAFANDYKIIYCSTDNKKEKAQELIRVFKGRHVDGYIITPPEGIEEDVRELVNEGVPVVLFDRYFPTLDTSHVVIQNLEGTKNAISYLIENGFRNIGFVTLKSGQTQMIDRLKGYHQAVEAHGLNAYVKEISFDELGSEKVVNDIQDFIHTNQDLDALFCSTNYLTISGLSAMKKLGKSIPEDLALIGFDDNELFTLYEPSISALAQPLEELSEKLMEAILAQLKGKMAVKKVELPVQFIARDSSKAVEHS
jgi:LacI family transcriptional regulator